jgi:alpha-L-rhamnosidase
MARFFISGIVGIKPLAPGFSKIEIRPQPGADLKWAKASMRVVPGKVSASWEKSQDEFKLSVDIPGNVQAKVCIPVPENADVKIYEGQTQVWPAQANADPNIKPIGKDKAYIDFIVGSGHYDFRAKR